MQLTREQQLALASDRHLAILANAGSGKTAVLVQRYTQLLLDGVDVRDITAITFTNKAAGEMLQRVARRLDAMLQNPDYVESWPEIKRVRERLNSARISTIHAFCARLLRDYPIEANVNPAFSELAEHESIALKVDAVNDVLESWLDQTAENSLKRDAALTLFRSLGRKRVEKYLHALLVAREDFNNVQRVYADKNDETIANQALKLLNTQIAEILSKVAPLLRESLLAMDRGQLTPAAVKRFDAAENALKQYQPFPSAETISGETLHQNITLIAAAADSLFTKSGSLRSTFNRGLRNDSIVPAVEAAIADSLQTLQASKNVLTYALEDAATVKQARILVDMAADAWQQIDEAKDAEGQLDFDDLQLRARELLKLPEVRTRLQRRLKHLMIDEFQDTNALQYAIAEALLTPGDEDDQKIAARDRARLFIVGDPKQSIYGFRGSDVRVFEQARADVKQLNLTMRKLELLPQTHTDAPGVPQADPEEALGDIRLNASFRLLENLAAFVNRVCGQLMTQRDSDFDISYEDLVCARSGRLYQSATESRPGESPDRATGSVELLIAKRRRKNRNAASLNFSRDEDSTQFNPEYDDNEGDYVDADGAEFCSEAELIARRIYQATKGDQKLTVHEFNGKGEVERPAEFGDITVLARSRNGFDELTTALRKYNIPFILTGGRGYFETQELLDIRSVLLFLQNQANDAAFAATLRSPFFALRDTELYEISVSDGATLWDKFNTYAKQYAESDHLTEAFRRSHTILSELTPLAQRLTIPLLIRWILDRTSWRGMTAGHERYEQMQANLEKLLDQARSFEERGFNNLHDFARELDILARHSAAEGEADLSSGANAVKIMTIHAAKGLEFPIVFLYKTNFRSNTPGAPLLSSELGLCFPANQLLQSGGVELQTEVVGPLFHMARRSQQLAEMAEEKRVLYVALTRARDHMIIGTTINYNDKDEAMRSDGFIAAILKALNLRESQLMELSQLRLTDELPILRDGTYGKSLVSYEVSLIHTLEQINPELQDQISVDAPQTSEGSADVPVAHTPLILTAPVHTQAEEEFYSASQLDLFKRDPEEYIRVYRLGLPASDDEYWHGALGRGADPQGDADMVLGTQAGSLIHAILETLPQWVGGDELDEETLAAHVNRVILNSDRPVSQSLHSRLLREATAIGNNSFIRNIARRLQADGNWQAELPFQLYINSAGKSGKSTSPAIQAYLIGVLDALVKVKDATFEIWDWKSNRVFGPADMEDLRERYRTQLEVYLYFLMRSFPEQETYTARLLFTRRANSSHNPDEWTICLTKSHSEMLTLENELLDLMRKLRDTVD